MRVFSRECCFGATLLCCVACSSDDTGGNKGSDGSGGNVGSGGTSQTSDSTGSNTGGSGGSSTSTSSITSSATTGEAGAAGAGGAGCDSPDRANDVVIHGAYRDEWGTAHVVNDASWMLGDSVFHVLEVVNDESWLVAENDSDNEFNPGLYSRFEWTEAEGSLYYCQSVFAAQSAEDASTEPPADAEDLDAGCGGFSWTALFGLNIVGNYVDSFDSAHEITKGAWLVGGSVFHVLEFSNDEGWLVAHNDCANAFNPGRYSRFEWVWSAPTSGAGGAGGADGAAGAGGAAGETGTSDGTIFYCQIGYDLASVSGALSLDTADRSDLQTGCAGFAWTELSGT